MNVKLAHAFADILFAAVNAPLPTQPQREKGELKPYPMVECSVCHRSVKGQYRHGLLCPFGHKSKFGNPCPGWSRRVKA